MLANIQGTPVGEAWYSAFQTIGVVSAVGFGLWYRKKYKLSVLKMLAALALLYAVVFSWVYAHLWIENGFSSGGTRSIVRPFAYLPLIALPISVILKIKWRTLCDFIAPILCLSTSISLIGCIFAGCCAGYPSKWGIYNFYYDGNAFPIQIIEPISVFAIFIGLLIWNKKRNYNGDGRTCPVMMIIFGSTRFVWEFARNNEKVWLGCSSLAFHALFMALVGISVLLVMKHIDGAEDKKSKKKHSKNKIKTKKRR